MGHTTNSRDPTCRRASRSPTSRKMRRSSGMRRGRPSSWCAREPPSTQSAQPALTTPGRSPKVSSSARRCAVPGITPVSICALARRCGAPALEPIACYEVIRHGDRVAVGAKQIRDRPCARRRNHPASIVIVGAGAAGAAAAEKLRRLGYDGAITLIGNEAPGPVDRPNLSKDFLAGTAPMEWVRLRDDEFYEKLKIEFVERETSPSSIPKGKSVTLESGRKVSYDKLLLAPGSEPARLPIEGASLPHVKTLRTLADAQSIIDAATERKTRRGHRLELHRPRSRRLVARAQSRSRRGQPRPRSARARHGNAGGPLRAAASRRERRSLSPRRQTARDPSAGGRARGGNDSRPMSWCSAWA